MSGGEDKEELRVLLVTNTMMVGGGAEVLVLNIFKALKQRPGVKVKLITLKKAALKTGYEIPEVEQYLSKDPDFYECGSYINLSILKPDRIDISEFTDIVKNFNPHVIHSNLFLSELTAHEVTFPGIKYFSHCHNNIPQLRNFSLQTLTQKKMFSDFYDKQHLMRCYLTCNNKFIAISADTKAYFESVLPSRLKKNIFLIDNAIVVKDYCGYKPDRDLDTIKIINVGRFDRNKNQQFLVDITRELVQRERKVEVVMLGKGEEYENVKTKAAANNLNQVISMPGVKANVADYYAKANIYVHTCKLEGFGLVLLEAMASGLPVVSLDGRGNRGLIEQGKNGYMLQNEDPVVFADMIEKVLSNKVTYQTMSAKANAFAKKYDIEEYINKLIQLYKSA